MRQRGFSFQKVFIYTMLILWLLVAVIPLVRMFQESLRVHGFENYFRVLSVGKIWINYINSIISSFSTIALILICVSLASYAFSKFEFSFKNSLYLFCLLALMLPSVVIVVPLFQTVKALHLINSLSSLIFPLVALNASYCLLILKNFMDGLPRDLIDAARIDGCRHLGILWRIILPLSKAALVVVVLTTFLNTWNEFFLPFISLRKQEAMTVAVIPLFYEGQFNEDVPKQFAACVLIALPMIILYIVLSKYFEKGFISGALKE